MLVLKTILLNGVRCKIVSLYYVLYNMLRFLIFNGRRRVSDFNTIIYIYIFSFHYIM